MKRKSITAGAFQANCLELLDQVQETGETLTITKGGKPVAKVVPVRMAPTSFGRLAHMIECVGSKEEIMNFNALGGHSSSKDGTGTL
jgi:prevent-host-death family protein